MSNMRGVSTLAECLAKRDAANQERRDRKWARDHYRSYQPIDPMWSAAIKDECKRINGELGSKTRMTDED